MTDAGITSSSTHKGLHLNQGFLAVTVCLFVAKGCFPKQSEVLPSQGLPGTQQLCKGERVLTHIPIRAPVGVEEEEPAPRCNYSRALVGGPGGGARCAGNLRTLLVQGGQGRGKRQLSEHKATIYQEPSAEPKARRPLPYALIEILGRDTC